MSEVVAKPKGAGAVMASRVSAPDALDYFPTPPWATRAFLPVLRDLDPRLHERTVWEPACGEGHMAAVLAEAFGHVSATDVFDYSGGDPHFIARPVVWRGVADFPVLAGAMSETGWDWVVTNPPFNLAEAFADAGLRIAKRGVALLVRAAWLEGVGRWRRLFSVRPPHLIAQYVERVPMTQGRWDPEASTATSYVWVVWVTERLAPPGPTRFRWIAPGARRALTTAEDLARFAGARAGGGAP